MARDLNHAFDIDLFDGYYKILFWSNEVTLARVMYSAVRKF